MSDKVEDSELYEASMKLTEFVQNAHHIIHLKTTGNLAELNAGQISQTSERIEEEAPKYIFAILNNLFLFANVSNVIHIPVSSINADGSHKDKRVYGTGDLYGTSAHHVATNFLRFNCLSTDFWSPEFDIQPPIFDIDILRYGLEWERMQVFSPEMFNQPVPEKKEYDLWRIAKLLELSDESTRNHFSDAGVTNAGRKKHSCEGIRDLFRKMATKSRKTDSVKIAENLQYLNDHELQEQLDRIVSDS